MGKVVKIQKNESAGSYIITLPKQLVDLKSWEKGQELEFKLENGEIVLDER